MPEFRTGRALVGGLPSGKTEVRQSQCVVMKSTDVRDRELVHGQTLDFLTTDADVEAVDDVEAVQNVEAEVDVEAETAALPIVTGPVMVKRRRTRCSAGSYRYKSCKITQKLLTFLRQRHAANHCLFLG